MKNFQVLHDSQNLSSAIEQTIFIKTEAVKSTPVAPASTDALEQTGANVANSEPRDPSPHKSGRHHRSLIRRKESTEISLTTAVNIDTTLGGADTGQVDSALRYLLTNTLGRERLTPNLRYDASQAPDDSLTFLDNGDKQANQAIGAFINQLVINLPGADIPTMEFSGNAKTAYNVGIARSSADNNLGNTITLQNPAHARRFEVGSMVMLVKADGISRSADTLSGTFRRVTNSDPDTGIVTLNGAPFSDADGSGLDAPLYLAYYEPENPVAINDIQTDIVGSVVIGNLPAGNCVRSASITCANSHELEDDCYGQKGLTNDLYAASNKLLVTINVELNLNDDLVEFIYRRKEFEAENMVFIVGEETGRHMKITCPKVVLNVPAVNRPENGRVPVTFEGTALESAPGAADEIVVEFL